MTSKTNTFTTTVRFVVLLWILFIAAPVAPGLGAETRNEAKARPGSQLRVKQRLDTLQKLIQPSLEWELLPGGKAPGEYRPGRKIAFDQFNLRAVITGTENFCGFGVVDSPLILKLKLYSKGFSDVAVLIDNAEVARFEIDGASGTGVEVVKEFIVSQSAQKKEYALLINVVNKGFKPFRGAALPPRRKEPKESYTHFSLNDAEIVYTLALDNQSRLKDWLTSMRIGYGLLNPDFKRFTFTGHPFEIEDNRKSTKIRLGALRKKLARAVMMVDPALLQSNLPGPVQQAILDSYQETKQLKGFAERFKVYLIGNAHIDIAWLWRMAETVQVAHNTFETVLNNMDEFPDLHYAQSQALTYHWMEEKYPKLFERIKEKVKTGRWEITGGMWVEPDCNLISGESWVRQLLYGKRYFKEKFGVDIDTGWNPDSFGYNWNMPQIYAKSGIKRFITQKIWWNDTTVFPHFIFWWQGVDDTRLLTYFPPVGYASRVTMPEDIVNLIRYEAVTGYHKSLILYGLGDHGGGPNREILNRVKAYKKLHIVPDFIHASSGTFLDQMVPDLGESIPVWKDELYLEYHRGTYTTQAKVKKWNRRMESRLSAAEKSASIAELLSKNNSPAASYPGHLLEQAWKIVLTNQFHDILPGSSITAVYRDAEEDYKRADKKIKQVTKNALLAIAREVDTSQLKGQALLVFNSLSWKRSDSVSLPLNLEEGEKVTLTDHLGNAVPLVISDDEDRKTLHFIAQKLPALGYRVYSLNREPGNEEASQEPSVDNAVNNTDNILEIKNLYYVVKISRRTGNMVSLFDRRMNRELLPAGQEANVLQVYEDMPEDWDAWNIGYTGRMWELNRAESVRVVEESSVRTVVRVKRNFLGLSKNRYSPTEEFPSSFFTQDIILYHNLERIDIMTDADWWEDHMMLKVAFPVNVTSDTATYEIPFAAIQRPTKMETLWEKARFEVPALRWADLSEKEFGVSLLNDSKYGYDIHGNVMKLSLLRSPKWPDPMADQGRHRFVYSIYTHPGDVVAGNTVQRAAELNNPLLTVLTDKSEGSLEIEKGLFDVVGDGVVLETIKKSEQGNGYILRLYESKGKAVEAEVVCFQAPSQVVETDLMETNPQPLAHTGKTITLSFKKFEIKTINLTF